MQVKWYSEGDELTHKHCRAELLYSPTLLPTC